MRRGTIVVGDPGAVGAVDVVVVLELQVAELEHTGDELEERDHLLRVEPDHLHRVLQPQEKLFREK